MDYLKLFIIPFSGLATGNHQFEFEIGKKFFENIEYSELKTGNLKITVDLEKDERMLRFQLFFEGFVEVECDRCLEPFNLPLKGQDLLLVKFGEEYHEEDDNVLVIPHNEHQINLSHFIYEMIMLSLPYQHIHPEDENGNSLCDPEQISKLENHIIQEETDPRWDKLKGLINNN